MRHALTRAREACARGLGGLFAAGPRQTGRLSITRVRFAFGGLLCMLLSGVFVLLDHALERLAQERSLRHEVVAERVFDELERELNAHLERESARPSSVYDAASSSVDAWAPYVVGYFTVADDYRVLSSAQLPAARSVRIQAALREVWPDPRHSVPRGAASNKADSASISRLGAPPSKDLRELKRMAESEGDKQRTSKMKAQKALDNSPEVLRRLNRAQEVRRDPSQAQSREDPFAY